MLNDCGTGISCERSVLLELCIFTASDSDVRSGGSGVSNERRVIVREHSLGMQLDGVRSTSQAAKSFIGTGFVMAILSNLVILSVILQGSSIRNPVYLVEDFSPLFALFCLLGLFFSILIGHEHTDSRLWRRWQPNTMATDFYTPDDDIFPPQSTENRDLLNISK